MVKQIHRYNILPSLNENSLVEKLVTVGLVFKGFILSRIDIDRIIIKNYGVVGSCLLLTC